MKKITELTKQEWKDVINNNSDFARALDELAMDNATFWVEEYLTGGFSGCRLPATRYEIGAWGYSYVTLDDDIRAFIEWFNGVQRDFELFNPDDAEEIEDYISVANKLYTGDYDEDEEESAEAEAERLKIRTQDIICRRLRQEYEYDGCTLYDYIDQWIDSTIGFRVGDEEEYYLHDDYTIVHHVPLKVVEAHEEKIV